MRQDAGNTFDIVPVGLVWASIQKGRPHYFVAGGPPQDTTARFGAMGFQLTPFSPHSGAANGARVNLVG